MSRKKTLFIILSVFFLTGCFFVWKAVFPDKYKAGKDEIAVYFKLDTAEDIGLIVSDYSVEDHDYGGGVSNADRSMIRHDDEIIYVWSREDLHTAADTVDFMMNLRIITQYVDPNYENIYPEEITRRINPLSWQACFGESYDIHISGDNVSGYKTVLKNHEDTTKR